MIYFAKVCFIGLIFTCTISAQGLLEQTSPAYLLEIKEKFQIQEQKKIEEITKIPDKVVRKELQQVVTDFTNKFKQDVADRKFIYHPEVSPLLQTIFQKIVDANPGYDLSDIQVLLGLDAAPNAYNRGDNIVVINFPLMSKLEDEGQLAFVICHEIAHQKLDHVYSSLTQHVFKANSPEMIQKAKEIKGQKYNKKQVVMAELKDFVYDNRRFKRAYEFQADSLGFLLFEKAYPKNRSNVINALEILQFLDEEKDSLVLKDYQDIFKHRNLEFNSSWLESEDFTQYNYQKNNKFWHVDSLRTHPEIPYRVNNLKKIFDISENTNVITDNAYHQLKEKIKIDEIEMFFEIKQYGESLYRTMIALKYTPDNKRLHQLMVKNLDKITAYKKEYKLNQCLATESARFSDSYNAFLAFVRNMRFSNLNQLKQSYEN